MNLKPPDEISKSLRRFTARYPNPLNVGLLMMRFGSGASPIAEAIRHALSAHGLIGTLASDEPFHTDLLPNVKTYIWGCGFGVAVYDKTTGEEFNPNVSFELGYMIALRRPVLILLDTAIRGLYSDLGSKLYEPFEPLSLHTIPDAVDRFVRARGLI
jgi:hypothetical protein